MPTKAGTCSMGTLGRVEHRARNASGHREDMPHCRPDDVRGGFVLCRCVEWADLARRLERRHGQNVGGKRVLTCRPRLFSPFALCRRGAGTGAEAALREGARQLHPGFLMVYVCLCYI
jgi:hypothetical protein